MQITDGHIHIFSSIDGANAFGPVKGCGFGCVENAGNISQFIPPHSEQTAFGSQILKRLMEEYNIDRAVLFQNPTIGSVNEEVGQMIAENPERFAGVLQVDPYAEDAAQQAAMWLGRYHFCALKFEMSTGWGWSGIHKDRPFHYDMLDPLMDIARENKLAVVFDTGDTSSLAYLPDELDRLAADFADVPIVIEHGGYLTPDGDRTLWRRMTDIARRDNVSLGICAIPVLLESEYPCSEAMHVVRDLHHRFGASKLIWGTDAPTTLMNYTYRQLIDTVLLHADFLSDDEKELVMDQNAGMIYFNIHK